MSPTATGAIEALLRAYYQSLERGEPIDRFYATDAEAGALGPVVKIGSGNGEVFTGFAAVSAEVRRVSRTFRRNRLQSRGLITRAPGSAVGDIGWFFDQVWWSGEEDGQLFASLTRWTGVCLRCPSGWKLLQLHVSEAMP